jgi:hypothetical protein
MRRMLVSLLVLLAAAPAAAGEWVRVDTPNFVVFGESGAARVEEVALEFERFREALGQVMPAGATVAAVPTVVVVFDTYRSFAPYRPRFNGRPVRLGGYFIGDEMQNVIALTVQNRQDALRTIFHEYAHVAIANVARRLPPWLSEGLADYYSTFAVRRDGRSATLGRLVPEHVRLLNTTSLLPLEQLLAVDHTSSLYNEDERRSVFYAQSWALVHMLMSGEPNRFADLTRYIDLIEAGAGAIDAWRQVFGARDFAVELRTHVTRRTSAARVKQFDQPLRRVAADAVPQPLSTVEAVLGDLLRHHDLEAAHVKLTRAVGLEPVSPLARALLGVNLVRDGQAAKGRTLLIDASADRSDWLVQYLVGVGLTDAIRYTPRTAAEDAGTAAAALARVLAARPDLPHALALTAVLPGKTGERLTAVRRALERAPGRDDYRALEADLMAAADPPAALPEPPPDVVPEFRAVGPDEQRAEGTLRRIECTGVGVLLHLQTARGVERFHTPRLEDVELITYRTDVAGRVRCGPRGAPEKVFVTWRTIAGARDPLTGRRVVAVEFLPD